MANFILQSLYYLGTQIKFLYKLHDYSLSYEFAFYYLSSTSYQIDSLPVSYHHSEMLFCGRNTAKASTAAQLLKY